MTNNNYLVGFEGRRTEVFEDLHNENSDCFTLKVFDITDSKTAIKNLEALITELGGLDLLVIGSSIEEINQRPDIEIEKKTVSLNVVAFTEICDWIFNYFEKQKGGHLIAITSIVGLRGNWLMPICNAPNSFILKYLHSLRLKAKGTMLPIYMADIRLGLIDPGKTNRVSLSWVSSARKSALQIYTAIVRKKEIAYVTKRWKLVGLFFKIISYESLTV